MNIQYTFATNSTIILSCSSDFRTIPRPKFVHIYLIKNVHFYLVIYNELKRLIDITKQTDFYYLEKRNISQEYDPTGTYNFGVWKHYLNDQVRLTYENLHKELLYTDEQQSFDDALSVFSQISEILNDIGE